LRKEVGEKLILVTDLEGTVLKHWNYLSPEHENRIVLGLLRESCT